MQTVNSDRAYDFIRKRILSGEYAPGAALMTEHLSAEIGVSRTPVRDALRQLESDGLVCIRPRLGASVKTMDAREFREMCEFRLALEGHAAYLAAINRSANELREIQYALEAMRSLTARILAAKKEEPLLNELAQEDVRFHIAIIAAAKNDLMKQEILRLHLINRVVAGAGGSAPAGQTGPSKSETDARRKVVLESHEEIFAALAQSNGPKAKAAMEHHIQDIIDQNLRAMAGVETGAAARALTADELVYSA
jgi:DNA-binding GntR family transcriptional regulator